MQGFGVRERKRKWKGGRKLSWNKNIGACQRGGLCLARGLVVTGSQWEQKQGGKRWGLRDAEGDQQDQRRTRWMRSRVVWALIAKVLPACTQCVKLSVCSTSQTADVWLCRHSRRLFTWHWQVAHCCISQLITIQSHISRAYLIFPLSVFLYSFVFFFFNRTWLMVLAFKVDSDNYSRWLMTTSKSACVCVCAVSCECMMQLLS